MPTFSYPQDFTGTLWLVLDGDLYVSSTGSDDDGDGSPMFPFATIQKAVSESAAEKKIVVGTGNYNENVDGEAKGNTLVADGLIIMDGDAIGGASFSNMGSGSASRLEGFTVSNYDVAIDNKMANVVGCTILNCNLEDFRGTLKECLLENIVIRATANTYLYNCTLVKVQTENFVTKTKFAEILDCHIDSQTVLYIKSSNTSVFDFCNQQPGSTVNIDDIAYSTASAVNVAFPQYQENGLSVQPEFNNPALSDYSLKVTSPLRGAGSKQQFIGAVGESNYQDPFTLAGATLTNVSIDNNGKYVLVNGYSLGTILTPIIDLGSERLLGRVNLFAEEHFETPPYNAVVDKDNQNTQPNRITFEMRYADTANELGEQPFREFIWEKQPTVDAAGLGNGHVDFNPTTAKPIAARFVQLRITLRDNTSFLLQETGDAILFENGSKILLEG